MFVFVWEPVVHSSQDFLVGEDARLLDAEKKLEQLAKGMGAEAVGEWWADGYG